MYHSTLGSRVIKKKKKCKHAVPGQMRSGGLKSEALPRITLVEDHTADVLPDPFASLFETAMQNYRTQTDRTGKDRTDNTTLAVFMTTSRSEHLCQ